jgi:hypothetical protein
VLSATPLVPLRRFRLLDNESPFSEAFNVKKLRLDRTAPRFDWGKKIANKYFFLQQKYPFLPAEPAKTSEESIVK